ncbi:ferritin-like protein [Dokdonia sp.]|uniref:ferritin-like domain-containing protein n=1 Tax=Dokdonia sp. TaxID=2024995 RepID=UPI003263A884
MSDSYNNTNPRRQKLNSRLKHQEQQAVTAKAGLLRASGAIKKKKKPTLKKLKANLQTAMKLEHSTIPPYLCALYSIKEGKNLMATEIIKSVVIEEMLHMVMVANLINAIGGKPVVGEVKGEPFIPSYPTPLPGNVDPSLIVNLTSMTKKQIRVFCKIEHPGDEEREERAKLRSIKDGETEYASIGDFYAAILDDMEALEEDAHKKGKTIFTGKTPQVTPEHYYGAGGSIIPVHNIDDARAVIDEIVDQGEGSFGSIFAEPYKEGKEEYLWFGADVEEYAHYFRFKEVQFGRFYKPTDSAHRDSPNRGRPTGEEIDIDWEEVYMMNDNPKMKDYPEGSEIRKKMYDFNKTYSNLLDNLNKGCNGKPEVLREGIMIMFDMKYKALELMKIPGNNGLAVGPSFEYIK